MARCVPGWRPITCVGARDPRLTFCTDSPSDANVIVLSSARGLFIKRTDIDDSRTIVGLADPNHGLFGVAMDKNGNYVR